MNLLLILSIYYYFASGTVIRIDSMVQWGIGSIEKSPTVYATYHDQYISP